jgi:hydrogenase maturation protein HypF
VTTTVSAERGERTGGSLRRVRARVEGTVQGVGFRPYIFRLTRELALGGFVLNDSHGVVVEVEGGAAKVGEFFARLGPESPPLAAIERVSREELAPTGVREFEIVRSNAGGQPTAPVTPDSAPCADCLRELFDPGDRRFRYPFVNCTNCGPRFSIVRGVPYDRPLTTMAGFEMCAGCRREYEDPADRRFHAQPNACPECGPAVRLTDATGAALVLDGARGPVAAAAAAVAEGSIVAVKGIGGFHLACRGDDESAVRRLRERKHREEKPFALMVADLTSARELVDLTRPDEELLLDRARPIVLAPRLTKARVAASVAPGARELGVMLAYSPLHHVLLADSPGVLVMTSANVSNEPIAYRDADALERLAAIADVFLLHDRPIETRTDDSVARTVVVAGRRCPLTLRRSRGYVPEGVTLPVDAERHVLATGAALKNTFCLAKGARAWVGHHIGDLENYETLRSFREGIAHFERLFAVEPTVVAHDLHPEYLSTAYALEREGCEPIGVQHHHAHLAACLAEHGERGPAVGAIFDGTGYGSDGTVWGGELLHGDLRAFERVGHLYPVRMPGGERAVCEPWRMACAWLVVAAGGEPLPPATLSGLVDLERWREVAALARTGVASPTTTSAGRLFDAVSALCGIRTHVTYEGQAAVELEAAAAAAPAETGAYPLPLCPPDPGGGAHVVFDARETIRAVVGNLEAGATVATVAARFHNGLADATADALVAAAAARGLDLAVLAGGVFVNRRLLERTAARAAQAGLRVLVPGRFPPGDGAISLGQAAIAAATMTDDADG